MARRTSIGLDIACGAVRAAELSFTATGVVLERCAKVTLPDAAVRGGEVLDPAAVSAALRQMWKAEGFSSRRVVIGIANPRVVIREVEVPQMAPADLKRALPYQVQDVLPMPVDAAVMDFHPLEVIGTGSGSVVRGLLVAAWRDTVTSLLSAVEGAGLTVEAIDLNAFAVLRASGSGLGTDTRTEALVDIGRTITQVVVHSGGTPLFVRILAAGGDDITEALAERAGVSFDEAEAMKRDLGLGDGRSAQTVVGHAVDTAALAFIDEVRSTIDYASATSGRRTDSIVLTGGGARLAGLAPRLAAITGLPVEIGSVARRLRAGRNLRSGVHEYASRAVGLALGATA